MSFLSPKTQSTPAPKPIVSDQPLAPVTDASLSPTPSAEAATTALLTDVKNPLLIDQVRRRSNVLGSAAATLG